MCNFHLCLYVGIIIALSIFSFFCGRFYEYKKIRYIGQKKRPTTQDILLGGKK